MNNTAPAECPLWCDRTHTLGGELHRAVIATTLITDGGTERDQELTVEVQQVAGGGVVDQPVLLVGAQALTAVEVAELWSAISRARRLVAELM